MGGENFFKIPARFDADPDTWRFSTPWVHSVIEPFSGFDDVRFGEIFNSLKKFLIFCLTFSHF